MNSTDTCKKNQDYDILELYESTPISTWKKILDPGLNYHFGDVLANNINILKSATSIIDVGCGWGGPAKSLQEEHNLNIEALTNSINQYRYIKSTSNLPVYFKDAKNFKPNKDYDMAIFIQSLTHMRDSALKNISNFANKILINDFVTLENIGRYAEPRSWGMYIRSRNEYKNLFNLIDFKIKTFNILKPSVFKKEATFWLNNINRLPDDHVTHHTKILKNLCETILFKGIGDIRVINIYAHNDKRKNIK